MKRVALSSVLALAANGKYLKPAQSTNAFPKANAHDWVPPVKDGVVAINGDDKADNDMWGYNPTAYALDARPAAQEPKSLGRNSDGCTINPWLLMAFLNHAPAAAVSKSSLSRTGYATWPTKSLGMDFVMKTLTKCQNNQKVKDVFAVNYLMQDKPELYNALSTGSTDAERGYKSYSVGGKDGDRAPLVKVLDLAGKQPFSQWTKSKVYLNMYKWKVYNGLYNGTPMVQLKRFQEKWAGFKEHKKNGAAFIKAHPAEFPQQTNPINSMDALNHAMPFLPRGMIKNFLKGKMP